mgnify:CR=1 FL=1
MKNELVEKEQMKDISRIILKGVRMFNRKNDIWSKTRSLRDSSINNIYVRRIAWTIFTILIFALGAATMLFAIRNA